MNFKIFHGPHVMVQLMFLLILFNKEAEILYIRMVGSIWTHSPTCIYSILNPVTVPAVRAVPVTLYTPITNGCVRAAMRKGYIKMQSICQMLGSRELTQ